MANVQPKALPEETAVVGADLYIIQKSSNDVVSKVQATNMIPASGVITSKIADDAVTDDKLDYPRWWQEIGRTTLSGAGDVITVSSLPARTYLRLVFHGLTSGQITAVLTFNGDTGSNYALRVSADGAADATSLSQTGVNLQGAISATVTADLYVYNRSTQEKIISGHVIHKGAAGAGTAPQRRDITAKWANTADAISSVTITNGGTGDYAIGAELIVLGHN